MSTRRTGDAILDDSKSWLRSNTASIVFSNVNDFRDQLDVMLAAEIESAPAGKDRDQMEKTLTAWMSNMSPYMKMPNIANSSLGGNNAMNPYWSFNEDDDIPLPMDKEIDSMDLGGMGAVYKESYEQHQQILWCTFGVPRFNRTLQFHSNAINSNLSKVMNSGTSVGITTKIADMFSDAVVLLLEVPFLPFIGMAYVYNLIVSQEERSSSYFSFKYAMPLYYRMVNTMMAQVAVGMGLYAANEKLDTESKINEKILKSYQGNVPNILKSGPDIYEIKNKRAKSIAGIAHLPKSHNLDTMLQKQLKGEKGETGVRSDGKEVDSSGKAATSSLGDVNPRTDGGIFSTATGLMSGILMSAKEFGGKVLEVAAEEAQGANHFVGFKIEKSLGSSESISNSVGDTGYASNLNGITSSAIDKWFGMPKFGSISENTSGGIVNWVTGTFGKFIHEMEANYRDTTDAIGMGGMSEIRLGGAYYDIPQVWKSSSFNKSYSINMKLVARLGDPVSVFQSIYIPLIMWMVAACPRQVGAKGYTSPFLIQCFSKGMLNTPLGLITGLNIKRGDSEFGWTIDHLPRSVDLSITISDLNPALYVGLADSAFNNILKKNDTMNNYIGTLSGTSLADFHWPSNRAKKAMSAWALINKNELLSPYSWGSALGNNAWFAKCIYGLAAGKVNRD